MTKRHKTTITIEETKYSIEIPIMNLRVGLHDLDNMVKIEAGPYAVPLYNISPGYESIGISRGGSSGINYNWDNIGEFFICSKTGRLFQFSYSGDGWPQRMHDEHVCSSVAIWRDTLEKHINPAPDSHWFRISGHSYHADDKAVCKDREPRGQSKSRGNYGRTYCIRMLGSREELLVDDLWHQGEIPQWALDEYGLEDNAKFVRR